MYTGGYVNEIEVLMASSNGDIGQVRWTTFLFWALMVITAFSGIKAQLANRKETIVEASSKSNIGEVHRDHSVHEVRFHA